MIYSCNYAFVCFSNPSIVVEVPKNSIEAIKQTEERRDTRETWAYA